MWIFWWGGVIPKMVLKSSRIQVAKCKHSLLRILGGEQSTVRDSWSTSSDQFQLGASDRGLFRVILFNFLCMFETCIPLIHIFAISHTDNGCTVDHPIIITRPFKLPNVGITVTIHPRVITIDTWYGHHSQSWVVYDIAIPTKNT